jgi:hypothetical protein
MAAASAILRLPAGKRTDALNKISANANAPGGSKRQTNGRPRKDAASNLRNRLGIYPIEATPTGALAYNVGGSSPATITVELGTPATTDIATSELDPVTWAGAGTRSLSVAINTTEVLGNAKLAVS